MQRYSNVSPRTRLTPQVKNLQNPEDPNILVINLQKKLIDLEVKYSKFVERCSSLLKSNELKAETKEFFSECSSSARLSPDICEMAKPITEEDHEKLIDALRQMEEGNLLKHLMKKISEIVTKYQDSIFRMLAGADKIKGRVKDSLNQMLGEIWEILFDNENSLRGIFKMCMQKLDKPYDLSSNSISRDLSTIFDLKDRLRKSEQEKEYLEKKLKEQNDCLRKILRDHKELKNRILTHSAVDNKRSSQNSFRSTFDQFFSNCSRSLTASPGPENKEEVKKLKQKNQKLKQKLKNLSKQNSILQSLNRKSFMVSDIKDTCEIEKKEIQDQLKALQEKLQGFEKIAKNLIDTSIRTELSMLGRGDLIKKRSSSSRHIVVESPELSMLNSQLSILEVDVMQKNIDGLEKEKSHLEEALEAVKRDFKSQLMVLNEEVGVYKNDLERIKGLLENEKTLNESLQIEKARMERQMQTFTEQIKDFAEGRKILSDKIAQKDSIIDELKGEISNLKLNYSVLAEKNKAFKSAVKETREEKAKLVSLTAKHAGTISQLEASLETLRQKESSSSLLQELEKNYLEKLEDLQTKLRKSDDLHRDALEKHNKILKTLSSELKSKDSLISLQIEKSQELEQNLEIMSQTVSEAEKSSKDRNEKYEKTLKNLNQELALTKSELESVKNEYRLSQTHAEEMIAMKNQIISSYEEKNSQIPELTSELLRSKKLLMESERKLDQKTSENKNIQLAINGYKEHIRELENEILKYKESNQILNENIEELEIRNDEIIREKEKILRNYEELAEEAAKYQENAKIYKEEADDAKRELRKKEDSLGKLNGQVKSLSDSYKSLESNERRRKENENEIRETGIEAKKTIEKLGNEIEEFKEKLEKSQSLILGLKKKCSDFEISKEATEQIVNHKNFIISSLENNIKEMGAVEKMLEESKKQISELNKKLFAKENEVKIMGYERDSLKSQEKMLNEQILQMEADYALQNSLKSEETQQMFRKISKIPILEGQVSKLNAEVMIKNANISDLTSKNTELSKEISELTEKLESIHSEIELLTKTIKEKTDLIKNLQGQLQTTKDKLNTSIDKESSLMQKISELSSDNMKLEKLLSDNNKTIKISEKKVLEKLLSDNNKTIKISEKKVNKIKIFIKSNKLSDLKSNLESLKSLTKKKLEDFREVFKSTEDFYSIFIETKLRNKEYEAKIRELTSENTKQISQLTDLKLRLSTLESQVKLSESSKIQKSAEALEYKKKYDSLYEEYNEKSNLLEVLIPENNKIKENLSHLEIEVSKTRGFEGKIKQLEIELALCETNLEKYQEAIHEKTQELTKIKKMNCELLNDIEHDKQKISELTEKSELNTNELDDFNVKFQEKNKQILYLTQKLEEKENLITELHKNVENLKSQITEIDDFKNKAIGDNEKTIGSLRHNEEELKTQLLDMEELKKKIIINKEEFLKLDKDNQELVKKLQEKDKMTENIVKNVQNQKEEIENLQNEIVILNNEIKKHLQENSKLMDDLVKNDNKIEYLENNLIHLEKALNDKETTLEDLRNIIENCEIRERDLLLVLQVKDEELKLLKNQSRNVSPQKKRYSESNPDTIKEADEVSEEIVPIITQKLQAYSLNIRTDRSKRISDYAEGSNIVPCKIIKVVNAAGKKWVLINSENGSFSWKDEKEFQFPSDDGIKEEEETNLDEIKIALGIWYCGDIIEAIEKLKIQANKDTSFSFKEDPNFISETQKANFATFSFRGEIFEGGLEISRIDPLLTDAENVDQIKNELLACKNKLEKKKRKIILHREQMQVLKEQIRKIQEEGNVDKDKIKDLEKKVQSVMAIDLPYLKQIYTNLVLKLKVDKNTENLIGPLYRILDFSSEETAKIQSQRKGSKKLKLKK
ncbi:hypothetical protein SteCoe_18707 [Stentor coeruleus]|uniref:AH domain-containing protein n=1 Tax=Stentor coeruleus TaxID=5963 RepID=A0A1R2BWH7_9CILI|nr:hypothetical protein SteCoe_18707 [Stentor coeruleus]